MRHKKTGRKLSREKNQRRALIKTLLGSLILSEKIKTTEAKAKEIRPLVEKIISKAKKIKGDSGAKVAVIRDLKNSLPARAAEKIAGDFLNRLNERNSGYVRIVKLPPRKSDSARMAVIEFI